MRHERAKAGCSLKHAELLRPAAEVTQFRCSTTAAAASREQPYRCDDPGLFLRLYGTPVAKRASRAATCSRSLRPGGGQLREPHVPAAALRRRRSRAKNIRLALAPRATGSRSRSAQTPSSSASRMLRSTSSSTSRRRISTTTRASSSPRYCACSPPAVTLATRIAAGPTMTAARSWSTLASSCSAARGSPSNVPARAARRRRAPRDFVRCNAQPRAAQSTSAGAGVRSGPAYQPLEAGRTRYFSHQLRKPL